MAYRYFKELYLTGKGAASTTGEEVNQDKEQAVLALLAFLQEEEKYRNWKFGESPLGKCFYLLGRGDGRYVLKAPRLVDSEIVLPEGLRNLLYIEEDLARKRYFLTAKEVYENADTLLLAVGTKFAQEIRTTLNALPTLYPNDTTPEFSRQIRFVEDETKEVIVVPRFVRSQLFYYQRMGDNRSPIDFSAYQLEVTISIASFLAGGTKDVEINPQDVIVVMNLLQMLSIDVSHLESVKENIILLSSL